MWSLTEGSAVNKIVIVVPLFKNATVSWLLKVIVMCMPSYYVGDSQMKCIGSLYQICDLRLPMSYEEATTLIVLYLLLSYFHKSSFHKTEYKSSISLKYIYEYIVLYFYIFLTNCCKCVRTPIILTQFS